MSISAPSKYDDNGNPNYTPIMGSDPYSDTPIAYKDTSGNIWNSIPTLSEDTGNWSNPTLITSSSATNDPYIKALGTTDPSNINNLYNLEQSNPTQFYNTIAPQLANQYWSNASVNNGDPTGAYQALQNIQSTDPTAYYNAQLNLLGQQAGWETVDGPTHGSAAQQQQIQALIPKAEAAGLSSSQIQSLINSGYSTGTAGGNQEMANAKASSGGFASGLPQFAGAIALGALTAGALDSLGGAAIGEEATAPAAETTTASQLPSLSSPLANTPDSLVIPTTQQITNASLIPSTQGVSDAIGYVPSSTVDTLASGSGALPGTAIGAPVGTVGTLNPELPATGASDLGSLGANLAPNSILGTGLSGGGAIGSSALLGANGAAATDIFGNAIPASSIGLNGSTATSALNSLNPQQLANALKQATNAGSSVVNSKIGSTSLPNITYQSAFLPSSQTVPIEGSRLTTTPTALKLASLLS